MLETSVQALAHEVPLLDPVADLLTNFVADQDGIAAIANKVRQTVFNHFMLGILFVLGS